MPQCASHQTTVLSSAHRFSCREKDPVMGFQPGNRQEWAGNGQRAQGPTDPTPQSSGPLLCTQSGVEWLPRAGGGEQETNEQC